MDENTNETYEPGHFMEENIPKRLRDLSKKQKIVLGAGAVVLIGSVLYVRKIRKDVNDLTRAVDYLAQTTSILLKV